MAVLGAESPAGGRVRDALCRARVPGERVTLYASTAGEAVLSEYGDEARLIQAIDLEELRRSDVLFLCDLGTDAARIETLGSIDGTIVDLTGALAGDPRSRLVRPTDQGDLDAAPGSVLVVPHEITILLLEVLAPLARAREIEDATAFVLRPASDFGDAGVDELREQTVRLLNFGRVPREVFARQLAFNVVPQSELEDASYATERRVIDETRRELAWDRDRLALRMAVVPVFLGHAAQLRVRRDGGVDEARSILRDSGVRLSEPGRSAPRTPLEASAEGPRTVVEVSDDGCGGVWVWLVSGELSARRAGLAVRAALDASGL